MTKSIQLAVFGVTAALLGSLLAAPAVHAADFQVNLMRQSAVQCSLTGSILNIDSVTGNIAIDLGSELNCYPSPVNALALNASLAVTGSTTVGGGTTGEGTVSLLLTTGLQSETPGVSCFPDGVTATNVNVLTGWSSPICTNCGPTATTTVGVQHAGSAGNGSIAFRARCTYQDPVNSNLHTIRSNIHSAQTVTVTPGTIPTPTFCSSVTQLANPNGLTPAMRQASGIVWPPFSSSAPRSYLEYTSIFGTSPNTYPGGTSDTSLYGFPGIDKRTMTFNMASGSYVALQFRAPSSPTWIERHGGFFFASGGTYTRFSIAPCPGQFADDPAYPAPEACHWGPKAAPSWKVTTGITPSCKLEPGKIYYLNAIFAGLSNLTQSTCGSASCKFEIRETSTYTN